MAEKGTVMSRSVSMNQSWRISTPLPSQFVEEAAAEFLFYKVSVYIELVYFPIILFVGFYRKYPFISGDDEEV